METRHFKNIIIGFGKAGRALAKSLSKNGEEALIIELTKQCMVGLVRMLVVLRLKL